MENVPKRQRLKRAASKPRTTISSGLPSYMQELPDDILLHIFKNLSFQDLIAVNRVCRRFRGLARDRSLWMDVDVSPCIAPVKALHKLLRSHFPKDMRSLKLRGYLHYYKGKPGQLRCILSNTFLKLLNMQCPKLQKFSLKESNIPHSLQLSDFPYNLTTLQLQNCHFVSAAMFFSNIPKLAASLTELDLSFSKGLSCSLFLYIHKLKNLQVLRLRGCETIRDRRILFLTGSLEKLDTLDLGLQTNITDSALYLIVSNLRNLRNLNISECNVTRKGIEIIAEKGQMLQKLFIHRTLNEQDIQSLTLKFPAIEFISNYV